MTTISIPELVAAVRAVAADHPDFVYDADNSVCTYAPSEDNPLGCIIGAAARSIGQSLDDAHEESLHFLFHKKGRRGVEGLTFTDRDDLAERWLTKVQALQDGGSLWGDAVACADETVPIP